MGVSNWQPLTMVRFERCYCCTVKTGSIVLGALMLVGSVLSIGDSAKEILNGGSKFDFSDFDLSYYQQHRLNTLSYYLSLANVVLSCISIIISGLLIYGVNKENPKLKFRIHDLLRTQTLYVLMLFRLDGADCQEGNQEISKSHFLSLLLNFFLRTEIEEAEDSPC